MGHDGSMAYLIIFDAKSEYMWGITMPGKVPPLDWLNALLTRIKPLSSTNLMARMDQGSELGCNEQL